LLLRAARPRVARAQPSRKLSTIGSWALTRPRLIASGDCANSAGSSGHSIAIAFGCGEGRNERLAEFAADLVRSTWMLLSRQGPLKSSRQRKQRRSFRSSSPRVGDPDGTGRMDLVAVAQVRTHKWSGCWGIADAVARSAGGSPPALLKITFGHLARARRAQDRQ
jgi:hypothetical protein